MISVRNWDFYFNKSCNFRLWYRLWLVLCTLLCTEKQWKRSQVTLCLNMYIYAIFYIYGVKLVQQIFSTLLFFSFFLIILVLYHIINSKNKHEELTYYMHITYSPSHNSSPFYSVHANKKIVRNNLTGW